MNDTTTGIEFGLQMGTTCKLILGDWAEGVGRMVAVLVFRKAIHAKIEIWAVVAGNEVFTREFLEQSALRFAWSAEQAYH